MYVSQINFLSSKVQQSQQKYRQPSLKDQLPSMVCGFLIGGIPAGIYCKSKGMKGKKLVFCTLDTASACAFLANIFYLLTHPPQKIETDKKAENNQNVSFKGILNLMHLPGESLKRKAEVSVNRYATSAATVAAALANTGFGDAAALTIITKNMCKKVFDIYGCNGGPTTSIGAIIAGKNLGINLATKAATIIPGAGNAINATITYTLHQLEGRALIELLEKYGDDLPDLSQIDLLTKLNNGVTAGIDLIENEKIKQFLKKTLDFFL